MLLCIDCIAFAGVTASAMPQPMQLTALVRSYVRSLLSNAPTRIRRDGALITYWCSDLMFVIAECRFWSR